MVLIHFGEGDDYVNFVAYVSFSKFWENLGETEMSGWGAAHAEGCYLRLRYCFNCRRF